MLFAAALMLVSGAFAQLGTSRQLTAKEMHKMMQPAPAAKVGGNPIWNDTMSYCGNTPFYSGIGTGADNPSIYWGIKLEAAALVGRNTIDAVEFYVGDADNSVGTYTLTIRQDSLTATPLLTETITTTVADTMAWKHVDLSTPLAIAQGHDLYVVFFNNTLPYPAAGCSPNNYDNGKWASIDGTAWDLVSNLGVDYTWMIRAISDTYIELPPVLTIEGPAIVRAGDTVVYTATSPNANSYTWNVSADYTNENGNTIQVVWLTAGAMTVECEATNNAGSTTESLSVDVVECNAIDVFPYVQNFEVADPCWLAVSNDPANDDAFGITTETVLQGTSSFGFSSYASAADYNQYLFSPEIELPATGDYMVSFWYNAENNGDAFRVMTSTTGSALSDFTTVLDMPTVAVTGEWVEARVVLPAGTKYICINYYGDYAYYLYIDSLVITDLSAPDLTLNGPASVGTGMPATFTAMSTLANTFNWSIDGVAQSETGATLSTVFTTAGQHTIEVSATNSVGTTNESLTVDVFSCDGITLPYAPDFSQTLGCWYNASDTASGWFLCSEAGVDGQIYSMSAQNFYGMFMIPLNPDNWIYSPSLTMPAEGSYDLCWNVMAFDATYCADHYAAYIIAEDGTETMLFEETLTAQGTSFSQRVATIPAGISGTFKVAFRHFNTTDGYVVILDDIKIVESGTVTGIDDASRATVAVYPNPASRVMNIAAEGLQRVEMLDMTGRTVLTATESRINLDGIASGMYIVRVTTASGIYTNKIVKE